MRRRRWAWAVALAGAACSGNDASVQLQFPTPTAREAVRRLVLEVYDGLGGRTCQAGLLGTAAQGEETQGNDSVSGAFSCATDDDTPCTSAWMEDVKLEGVGPGRSLVYVRGFTSVSETAPVVFEGCTDAFDTNGTSENVPLPMDFVLPDTARLELVSGLGQVVFGPGELPEALGVRAVATDPRRVEGARNDYVLPGFPVRFQVEDDGPGRLDQARVEADVQGVARTRLELTAVGAVEVTASGDEVELGALRFVASAVSPAEFSIAARRPGVVGEAKSVALGDYDGDGRTDAAVLSCRGDGACGYEDDLDVTRSLGRSAVHLVTDLLGEPQIRVAQDLDGRLPVVAKTMRPMGRDLLAVAHGRQLDCAVSQCPDGRNCGCLDAVGVPCSCEASVASVMQWDGSAWIDAAAPAVTTSSNAVDMEVFVSASATPSPWRMAMLMRGRIDSRRSCNPVEFCNCVEELPDGSLRDCSCPRDEFCGEAGVCLPSSQRIEQFRVEVEGADLDLFDPVQCLCDQPGSAELCELPAPGQCTPRPELPTNGVDDCGRAVLGRIPASPVRSPVVIRGLAVGPLSDPNQLDMVVASQGRTSFVEGSEWKYDAPEALFLNDDQTDLAIASMDPLTDAEVDDPDCDRDERLDLVWWSRTACRSFECPVAGVSADGVDEEAYPGCLGLLLTAGRVLDQSGSCVTPPLRNAPLNTPQYCRRIPLRARPDGVCINDFNRDGHTDVLVASADDASLSLFAGDGRGGLTVPPQTLELPGETEGGPIACDDFDGDGRPDVVAVGRDSRVLYIFRTGP